MFNMYFSAAPLDMAVDAFQGTKRAFTNAIIVDKVLNRAANDFINAQTTFAKMMIKNSVEIAKYFVDTNSHQFFPNLAGAKKTDAKESQYV